MKQLLGIAFAVLAALLPITAGAAQWGSGYGDPYGFCAEQSNLPGSYAVVVTNDPAVPTNPERDTFWGWHSNPGYDDWFGYFYGDFRGRAADESGWMRLMTVSYGSTGHWNFSDFGWAVHGHAKQYISYYNWTFAGGCGWGYGNPSAPPPYMADVVGNPVTDIYVDSVPPFTPQPIANAVLPDTVSFIWSPVPDRGDGDGPDSFASGLDHYSSWLSVDGGPPQQLSETPQPVSLRASGLRGGQEVCAHVAASDRLGNRSPDGIACARTPTGPAPVLIVGTPPGIEPPPAVPSLVVGPVPQYPPAPVPTLIVGPVPQYFPAPPPAAVPTLIVGPVPQSPPFPTLVVGPVPQPPAQPAPPPVPPRPPAVLPAPGVGINPVPGLVGLPAWFWLSPDLFKGPIETSSGGVSYRITLTPLAATWDFGDGWVGAYQGSEGIGLAYPSPSPVVHVYQSHSRLGFTVQASVLVGVTWWASNGGAWQGPFDLPPAQLTATATYVVQQAQPELQ